VGPRLRAGIARLTERGAGVYDVVWKRPSGESAQATPIRTLAPVFSAACRRVADIESEEGFAVYRIDCGPKGLREQTIGVAGLPGHGADVLVRIHWADDSMTTTVLRSDAPEFVVPGTGAGLPLATVLWRYGGLGVEHILTGADHLAFVLGLLLLVDGWAPLVKTITAFTCAHTLTLGAAVLGLVHVPPPPVEAMIAISILVVAIEVLRPADAPPTLAHRAPWLVAFLFGLMHGLGFAGALAELGLPPDHLPAALLAFNGGVEIGQLAFVVVMLLPIRLLRRGPLWLQRLPAYGIGALAIMWTLERVAAFWS
jgi:hydrogenase/urease accessory protein HupE